MALLLFTTDWSYQCLLALKDMSQQAKQARSPSSKTSTIKYS